jgi:hypothetical protein
MSESGFANHYDHLGIPSDATIEQIRAAVKDQRRTWVLRQNAPSLERRQEAERMLAEIAEAERVLLDPGERAVFDQQLSDHIRSAESLTSETTPVREAAWSHDNLYNGGPRYSTDQVHNPVPSQRPAPSQRVHVGAWGPDHPQGTLILVLGVAGLFCSVLPPVAWYFGSRALRDIRQSGVRPANERRVVIGHRLGMILSIVTAIYLLLAVVITMAE